MPAALGYLASSSRARKKPSRFAMPADERDVDSSDAAEASPPPVSLVAVAAAQGPAPAAAGRQPDEAAAAHGQALLGALAGLQLASLREGGSDARRTLSELALTLPDTANPGLGSVLQAIAQRAAVELARGG